MNLVNPPQHPARVFKGWVKPGPFVPGDLADPNWIESGETCDAISGFYRLFQYEAGHRFSTDDLLVAWYGTSHCPRAQKVLDLGSGIGSVAMISAWRLPQAQFVTIEAQDISIRLARKSARFNGIQNQLDQRLGDFRDPKILGVDERFDLITGSPPYFPLDAGVQPDHPQKLACRFEVRGSILDYCQAASPHLDHGGVFATIFPEEQLKRVQLAADQADLIILKRKPVVFKEGEPPLLSLFLMGKKEHFPDELRNQTWIEPSLIIRKKDGSIHPEHSMVKLSVGFPP